MAEVRQAETDGGTEVAGADEEDIGGHARTLRHRDPAPDPLGNGRMWWHRGHVKRPPPPVLALVAGFVQQAWARPVPPTSTRRALAAATAAASVGMAAAAATQFRAHHTTVEPFDPSKATALVVSGPNAVTRNPMYVGMAGVLVSNAIRLRGWRAVLPVVAFVGYIDRFQIAAEELALAEKFGAEYEAYRASVPRWIGPRSNVQVS